MADRSARMDVARDIYRELDAHWTPEGMDRPGYSRQENEAIAILAAAAPRAARAFQDVAGNVHIVYPGKDPTHPVFMTGSHVDAVPRGGRYDGTAGIVAGLAALHELDSRKIQPPQPVCVTIWRGEESACWNGGQACLGSKFITGGLSAGFIDAAKSRKDGRTLRAHMDECGVETAALQKALEGGQVMFPLGHIGAYVETHIEQGPVLLDQELSLGVVTDIRGNVRFPKGIVFNGQAGHSGSTPQPRRRDSALAANAFITVWENAMITLGRRGDLVYAIPDIHVIDASPTTIAARTIVQPEIRSTDQSILYHAHRITIALAELVARERKLTVEVNRDFIVVAVPSEMNEGLQDRLARIMQGNKFSSQKMPSGAGHDAGILANMDVPCGMIFIRHGLEGLSHDSKEILGRTPEENPFRPGSDFDKAVQVMQHAMLLPTPASKRESGSIDFQSRLLAYGAKPYPG